MQKVDGSSPFIRFVERPWKQGLLVSGEGQRKGHSGDVCSAEIESI